MCVCSYRAWVHGYCMCCPTNCMCGIGQRGAEMKKSQPCPWRQVEGSECKQWVVIQARWPEGPGRRASQGEQSREVRALAALVCQKPYGLPTKLHHSEQKSSWRTLLQSVYKLHCPHADSYALLTLPFRRQHHFIALVPGSQLRRSCISINKMLIVYSTGLELHKTWVQILPHE